MKDMEGKVKQTDEERFSFFTKINEQLEAEKKKMISEKGAQNEAARVRNDQNLTDVPQSNLLIPLNCRRQTFIFGTQHRILMVLINQG